MTSRKISVRDNATGDVIAESISPLRFEGYLYFDEKDVDMERLEVTDRIYTCWYKGSCFWVDLKKKDGKAQRNVAWVYRDPSPGYEYIKDKIGFWSTAQGDLVIETGEPEPLD